MLSVLLLLTAAHADEGLSGQAFVPAPVAGHAVFDFRVGAGTTDLHHPTVCAEVAPVAWLSVEGCGTGSGFLHHGDQPDMAHFRARAASKTWRRGRSEVDARLGLGFAEIQSTADQAGFLFGEARTADPIEAAGPELSASAHGRWWLDQAFYATADLNVGAAHIPAAPDVMGRGGPVVPFASATFGFGF